MEKIEIYKRRIVQFIDKIYSMRYSDYVGLASSYIYHKNVPIPYEEAVKAKYKQIKKGDRWGELWGCAWFRFEGVVPDSHAGKEVVALIDIEGEGCVVSNGIPERGITYTASKEGPRTDAAMA